jgi:hypothetical protein
MDDLDNIMKEGFKFDEGKFRLLLIELLTSNQTYLKSILIRQLEIQETLKGLTDTEMREAVDKRFADLTSKIDEVSGKEYHTLLSAFLS